MHDLRNSQQAFPEKKKMSISIQKDANQPSVRWVAWLLWCCEESRKNDIKRRGFDEFSGFNAGRGTCFAFESFLQLYFMVMVFDFELGRYWEAMNWVPLTVGLLSVWLKRPFQNQERWRKPKPSQANQAKQQAWSAKSAPLLPFAFSLCLHREVSRPKAFQAPGQATWPGQVIGATQKRWEEKRCESKHPMLSPSTFLRGV